MDNEMIERCTSALETRFKIFVEFNSGLPFAETKVSLPSRDIWKDYFLTIIKAMREPTEKMLHSTDIIYKSPEYKIIKECYTAMIDSK